MKPYQNIRLIDHWILDRVSVIGEISSDSLIPDGGVIIEEKGNLITQFLQRHGEDMGNDPDRLASYACKDDSFHKVLPYKIQRLRLRLRMRRKLIP